MLRKVFYIIGSLLLVVSLVAAAGLGIWAYSLNNQLAQAQADYESLKADYSKAKKGFTEQSDEVSAALENAQKQIERLEDNLKAAQEENDELQSKLTTIKSKVAVLNTFWFSTDASFQRKVDSMDDEQLKDLSDAFFEEDTLESYIDLMTYMIESIAEISGISWESNSFGYTSVVGQAA